MTGCCPFDNIKIAVREKVRLVLLALAEGFVEEDGGSGGGVEAFDVVAMGMWMRASAE